MLAPNIAPHLLLSLHIILLHLIKPPHFPHQNLPHQSRIPVIFKVKLFQQSLLNQYIHLIHPWHLVSLPHWVKIYQTPMSTLISLWSWKLYHSFIHCESITNKGKISSFSIKCMINIKIHLAPYVSLSLRYQERHWFQYKPYKLLMNLSPRKCLVQTTKVY